ncbi:unnamed protein product, partial [Amoebophrya sp. A25]|eukprot:GSA25T00001295001.1
MSSPPPGNPLPPAGTNMAPNSTPPSNANNATSSLTSTDPAWQGTNEAVRDLHRKALEQLNRSAGGSSASDDIQVRDGGQPEPLGYFTYQTLALPGGFRRGAQRQLAAEAIGGEISPLIYTVEQNKSATPFANEPAASATPSAKAAALTAYPFEPQQGHVVEDNATTTVDAVFEAVFEGSGPPPE